MRGRLLEVQEAVGVVLDDQDLVLARDLEDLHAALPAERHAGRVLERRDRVEELDPPAGRAHPHDGLAQRLGDHALGVHVDVDDLGLERPEDDHRGDVAGPFGQHDVAGVEEELGDQLERVLRSGGDDDVVDARVDALERHDVEDLLAQPRAALSGAVLQGDGAVLAHRALDGGRDQFLGQGRDERHPTGERDDLGTARDGEQGSDLGRAESRGALGVVRVPRVEVVALGPVHIGFRSVGAYQAKGTDAKAPPPRRGRGQRQVIGPRPGTPRDRPRGPASAWRRSRAWRSRRRGTRTSPGSR